MLTPFYALDFETTGSVRGYVNEPWQIGLARFRPAHEGEQATFVLGEQEWMVETVADSLLRIDASRPFNRYAPGRWASLREEMSVAPAFHDIWEDKELGRILIGRDTWLLAHNASAERTTLRHQVPLHADRINYLDSLRLSEVAWPNADHSLEHLIPALGLKETLDSVVSNREPHDAFYDAVACGLLLVHISTLQGWSALSLPDLRAQY